MRKTSIRIDVPEDGTSPDECENIDPDHCEELRKRSFTNDPGELFLEIKALEERYKYTLSIMKEKIDKKINFTQKENGEKYRRILSEKKKELEREVNELTSEMQKKMDALQTQEQQILKEIEKIYQEKADQIIEEAIKILEFDF